VRRAADLRCLDGILLLDKPAGPSSNQALQRARRLLQARKAGHAGTLDPLATGLLPVLFGEATKFSGALSDADKMYEATLWFGMVTTTGDLGGEILERRSVRITAEQLHQVAEKFRGEIRQVPPMHSALKVNGRPLYERARRGETLERASRLVHIAEFAVGEFRADECDIRVRCSKGTYIRTLAEDMGRVLGCGATLKRLRRTMVGSFDVGAAISLDALESRDAPSRESLFLPIDAALNHLPAIRLMPSAIAQVLRGQATAVEAGQMAIVRIYAADSNRFIGLGSVEEGLLRPRRLVAVLNPSLAPEIA
jgi:tRNA pseudouridine55 synthase